MTDAPKIGECKGCGKTLRESDARVEDHRGLWHPEHYEAKPPPKTRAKTK